MSQPENKKLLHKKKHEIETNILLLDTKKTIDIDYSNKNLNSKQKIRNQFILDRLLKNLDTITKTINIS